MKISEGLTAVTMGILFFGVFTPIGLAIRMARRDPLRLGFAPQDRSYWVARTRDGNRRTSMTKRS